MTEMTEASAPNSPPVSQSGPETVEFRRVPPASVPDTAKPKMLPCTKFQDQWMPMGKKHVYTLSFTLTETCRPKP